MTQSKKIWLSGSTLLSHPLLNKSKASGRALGSRANKLRRTRRAKVKDSMKTHQDTKMAELLLTFGGDRVWKERAPQFAVFRVVLCECIFTHR